MSKISENEIARKTLEIFPLMGRLFEANMRASDDMSPVHFHVLTALTIQHHTLGELASYLNVTPASMSRTVTIMEERNWLTRTRSKEDRRVVYIEITPNGYQVLRDVGLKAEQQFANVFKDIPQQQREHLMNGLSILITAFNDVINKQRQENAQRESNNSPQHSPSK